MAEYITNIVDPMELIGYVRELEVPGVQLDAVLPNVVVSDIEYELQNIEIHKVQVARYRSWDTAPPLGKRPGFATVRGEIPPLGLSMRVNERELPMLSRLRAEAPREGDTADRIWNDAETGVVAVQSRIEIARGDLLTDGIVTIEENGVKVTADFSVPGTHIVAAGTAWSNHAGAVPITDERAWLATYKADNAGQMPAYALTSDEVIADLTLSAQYRNLAPVTGVVPGIITDQTVAQVRRSLQLPPLVSYNTLLPDASDNLVRVINERKFIYVRPGVMGSTFYGVTPDAMVMAGEGIIKMQDAPGVIAFAEQTIRPAAMYTTGAGVALPVLRDPNALFVATV